MCLQEATDSNLTLTFLLQSGVQVLNLIQELLPHVAALNLLSTNMHQAAGSLDGVGGHQDFQGCFQSSSSSTTSHHYAWVESDHPYKPASVSNYRCVCVAGFNK